MSTGIISGQKVYVGGYDVSCDLYSLELTLSCAELTATPLCKTAIVRKAGLHDASFNYEGYFQAGAGLIDPQEFARLGTAGNIYTVAVQDGSDGTPAYITRVYRSEYSLPGQVGEMFKFSASAIGSQGERAVRTKILAASAARASTGTGTQRSLGAIAAGKKLYAALHVLAVSGTDTPTVTVKIQSAATGDTGFASPTDRITFTAATAIGAQWSSVAGAITDTRWRAQWTISGTNPSLTFLVSAGIL